MADNLHGLSTYNPDYCDMVTAWLAEGKTLAGFADKIDVNRVTLWDWTKAHVSFDNAVKKGREIASNIHAEKYLLDNIENQNLNNVVAVHYFRNVLKLKTRDDADTSATDKLADALKSVVTTYALPDNGRLNVDKTPT